MLIGEICKKSGLSKDTIRHYEQLGLLKSSPRQAGSRVFRDYHDDTFERLSMIAYGKLMGAKLGAMVPVINRALSGESSEEERRKILLAQLAMVEAKIEQFQQMREELRLMAADPNKPNADRAMKRLGLWIE